jgi:dolichol-phosphate mannosyltransferase
MSSKSPIFYFLIPAFNEQDNLVFLFANLRRISAYLESDYQIIVVDDCSTDGTAEKVEEFSRIMPVTLVTFDENRGPGAAFEAAFRKALETAGDNDIFVTLEADNTSDLCILGRMREQINRGADVALASVYGSGKIVGAPLLRRMLSLFANVMLKYALGFRKLNTFSSFFRMYRSSVIAELYQMYGANVITEPGFVCMVELLIKFKVIKATVVETPMLLDSNIRVGDSKMKIIRTALSYFRVIRKKMFTSAYRPTVDQNHSSQPASDTTTATAPEERPS